MKTGLDVIRERPFALFTGYTYYPPPGWKGHQGQYATRQEADQMGDKINRDDMSGCGWWQVVDLSDLCIVSGSGCGHTGLDGKCSAS